MQPAIRVTSLGKRYRLGLTHAKSLNELAARWTSRLRGRSANDTLLGRENNPRTTGGDFWALQDIDFEVAPGEVVGIIGRNGAGKSTLLKILSRVTRPTTGQVDLRGRVGSLLEVGTGFHPELTGRENVYMNGTLLGMTKREVTRRFDEILDFAGVEKFIDTPVKRYSSGMKVRLGFAVAAHLEPEILIVDEVLAVGDAAFQKKCLGKMSDVASHGRTILFVSHNMAAVRSLCQRGVVLINGSVRYDGEANSAIASYLDDMSDGASHGEAAFKRPEGAPIWMASAELIASDPGQLLFGESVIIQIRFASTRLIDKPRIGFVIKDPNGTAVLNANNHYQKSGRLEQPTDGGIITCHLGAVPLMAQRYTISLYLGDEIANYHTEEDALSLEVSERDVWGMGQMPPRVSSMWWNTDFRFEPVDC